ncbi:MAG: NHL repeat-containing protein [Rhodothermia bacterium]
MYRVLSAAFLIGATMTPGLGSSPALAQDADTTITEATTLAVFQDPVALAADPTGVLYVVDAVTSSITRLTPAGEVISTYGGPGRGEYQFDEPSDIDVSAGLVWLVADAGNSRIKRYSSEFLHLASMPVDVSSFAVQQSAGRGGFREEEGAPLQYASGRPISVAATISDETYAVDAENGTVIKWDASRRIERVFGTTEGALLLVDPVSVAVDRNSNVYVADRGLDAVLVFDRFGTYLRMLAENIARDVESVYTRGERMFVVLPHRLLVYDLDGLLLRVYDVRLGEPLRDVAVADGAFFLLTERRLVRAMP